MDSDGCSTVEGALRITAWLAHGMARGSGSAGALEWWHGGVEATALESHACSTHDAMQASLPAINIRASTVPSAPRIILTPE